MKKIDRRSFMQRSGLAGLSLAAIGLGINRAVADPDPPANAASVASSSAEPDVYSFKLGGTDAFVILDGVLEFPGIQPSFAPEATAAQVNGLMQRSFLPADRLSLCMNVLVLKAKSGVMLFDAGAGRAFGAAGGKLVRGLARIGITPKDVKTIYLTHAHPDHIGGLVDESNAPIFPTARIVAAKTEINFWTGESPDVSGMRTPADASAGAVTAIKGFLKVLKPNLDLREPGKLSDEVEMLAAPGHTPGHALFLVSQGDEKLLVIGDAVHVFALQFPHPEWTMAYDTNPTQAIATRRKLFQQAASERTALMGFHMPFPGIGHVRSAGAGFEWVPKPWA